ncbi:MAG TPA: hypothetical protein VFZ00_17445 [Solirubrobacter sp.]|nr:hypothetical protein [Solirubrobacter sp.]
MVVGLGVAPSVAEAQYEIYQCQNGGVSSGVQAVSDCTGAGSPYGWTNGNLNSNHSTYREGEFVPFRIVIRYGLTAGQRYTVGIGYDAIARGLHAYDYLGTYDASRRPDQSIVPCDGVAQTAGAHRCGESPSTLAVPRDEQTTFPSTSAGQQAGEFSAWGADLESATYVPPQTPIDANTGVGNPGLTVERSINLVFTARGPAAVIAWGGHIASLFDWGPARTFAQVASGAGFHMRFKDSRGTAPEGTTGFNPGNTELTMSPAVIRSQPSSFTTEVRPAVVQVGDPVIDTARLTGAPTPRGSVEFFVCGPAPAGFPDCASGGRAVDDPAPVTGQGTAAVSYRPSEAGYFCFRAEYTPSPTAPFSPDTHTNLTSECFQATEEPVAPQQPTTLNVIKHCVPASDRGRFEITIRGKGIQFRRTLRCGNETGELEVPPGDYRVTERGAGGTNLNRYDREIGGDCDADGRVTVEASTSATCTINNIRRPRPPRVGHLTLRKICVPSDDPGRFTLRVADVTARNQRCGAVVGPLALRPGTYRVTESAGTGTDASAYTTVIGGACDEDGSVRLRARQSLTCTITNARRTTGGEETPTAVLTLVKRCRPADDDGRFVLDIDEQEFPGIRCGQSTGPITVGVGTHLVGEDATRRLVDNYEVEFGGDCSPAGAITLAAGQRATCTVTNARIEQPAVVRPASVCYTLRASPRTLQAGRRGSIEVRAVVGRRTVQGVLVRLRGAGVSRSGRTGSEGVARFAVRPSAAGSIAVTTPRQFGCPPVVAGRISVRAVSPTVTG